jgi:hypothetical protein
MRDTRRLGVDCIVEQAGSRPESDEGDNDAEKRGPGVVIYCAVSGLIATTMGAVVSLAAGGTERIAAWAAVLVAVSTAAGLGYGSDPVNAAWSYCRRALHRVVGS